MEGRMNGNSSPAHYYPIVVWLSQPWCVRSSTRQAFIFSFSFSFLSWLSFCFIQFGIYQGASMRTIQHSNWVGANGTVLV